MGKLIDSLKGVTHQLEDIQHGIEQMQALGQELADNTLIVAETALRTGYAYAQAEVESSRVQVATNSHNSLPAARVLDADQLGNATAWTIDSLKARFKHLNAAYQHLRSLYGIKLQIRSWKTVTDAFNGNVSIDKAGDRSLENRIYSLEQTATLHLQRIIALETQVGQLVQQLQQLVLVVMRENVLLNEQENENEDE
jgi:uncharacterized coiled-coil protein SlyX